MATMSTQPPPPPPDTTDWTVVLQRPCEQCGFDASALEPSGTGARIRATVPRWDAVVSQPDVADRSEPQVWSALEYACHVRDVCGVFARRLAAMLDEDGPTFADWDQERAAVEGRYWTADPPDVARAYAGRAVALAASFDEVAGAQWRREGLRGDGFRFTVASLGAYLVHDLEHHLHDVDG